MVRFDGRANDELRKINIVRNYNKYAEGSVLVEFGDTRVICTASVEERVPPFLKGLGEGWVSCEYGMIPRSTHTRKTRDISKGKLDGRTAEIQRLIGRALRSVVDLKSLGENTIWIDCDVIQADGGTRTASITGAFIALVDAVNVLCERNGITTYPIKNFVSAVSVGVLEEEVILDLCYEEDSKAIVDMNIVMTDTGKFIEIQGTGEEAPFSREELNKLLSIAEKGLMEIVEIQKSILGEDGKYIGKGEIIIESNEENNISQ